MPYASVRAACLSGIGILPVTVEVDLQPGLPLFTVIGLPDKAVDEARQRVRSALKNSGLSLPLGKITVNLSPATVRKQGAALDLAIAVGILAASGRVKRPDPAVWVLGELSLSGEVVPLRHVPAMLVEAYRRRVAGVILPDQPETELVSECPSRPVRSLSGAVSLLQGELRFSPVRHWSPPASRSWQSAYAIDQVKGQSQAKRALEIALSGGFNLMLSGPPGSGKSMLAKAALELLPLPSRALQLEIVQLQGLGGGQATRGERPLREPHHSVSLSGMLGGGTMGRPGELSLAHGGILFLDELPEFRREVREALRQPMQDKSIRFNRQGGDVSYPADCLIIAAQNPCPCGLLGAEGEACRCQPKDLARYQRSLSEPLLERFQLFCDMPKMAYAEWTGAASYRPGAEIASRIERTRRMNQVSVQSELEALDKEAGSLMERATGAYRLSARVTESLIRVARTIARLEESRVVSLPHLQEALQYRRRSVI